MRKLQLILAAASLTVLLLLGGCSSEDTTEIASVAPPVSAVIPEPIASAFPEESSGTTPATEADIIPEDTTSSTERPEQSPSSESTPAPAVTTTIPAVPSREAAMACIGQSLNELLSAIGQPNSTSYANSCMGAGDDGELYYDGFTVYTYREAGNENVVAVE